MGLLSILAFIYQALSSRNADLGSVLPLGESYEMCVSVIQDQHFYTDNLDKCNVLYIKHIKIN